MKTCGGCRWRIGGMCTLFLPKREAIAAAVACRCWDMLPSQPWPGNPIAQWGDRWQAAEALWDMPADASPADVFEAVPGWQGIGAPE